MQYLGGKSRISKAIASYLNIVLMQTGIQTYYEPFVGAAWVLAEVNAPNRFASDIHGPLITMYKALQAGWIPPDSVSEEEHRAIRLKGDINDPMTAFAGFGCSFGGTCSGGYARNNRGRNYATDAKRSLLRQLPSIKDAVFNHCSYADISPTNALIYCDPPYENTRGYSCGKFDSNQFWDTVRLWSDSNLVIVSEYQAPKDFISILDLNVKTELRGGADKARIPRVERLFVYEKSPLLSHLLVSY